MMLSDDGEERVMNKKAATQSKVSSSKAEVTTAKKCLLEHSTQLSYTTQYPRRKDSQIVSTLIKECPTISFH